MMRILLIFLAVVVAIILWNAGAATVGAVPLFLLYLMGSVGKGHAQKISALMQEYVDTGSRSSPIFEFPGKEAQDALNAICTVTGTSLQKTRRDYTITLTAQAGFFWCLGGSAKVLCSLSPKNGDRLALHARLSVRYKQQVAVHALRITEIK